MRKTKHTPPWARILNFKIQIWIEEEGGGVFVRGPAKYICLDPLYLKYKSVIHSYNYKIGFKQIKFQRARKMANSSIVVRWMGHRGVLPKSRAVFTFLIFIQRNVKAVHFQEESWSFTFKPDPKLGALTDINVLPGMFYCFKCFKLKV